MNKIEARKYALALRKTLDTKEASKQIIDSIVASGILNCVTKIGLYYPLKDEIDLMPLVSIYKDKSFYLPKTKKELEFARYVDEASLVPGPFKTLEPTQESIDRDEIECFIVPCVAISSGKRIGYGKGYYDRYLDGYLGLRIGVCYKECILDVPLDTFDVSFDYIFKG